MPRSDSLRDPLRDPLHTGPDFEHMTDAEIEAFVAGVHEGDKWAIPEHLIPDGMAYQWIRCEVYGKPDNARLAEAERAGWRPVPAKRHDGLYMPPGYEGPIVIDGLQLYEIPKRVNRIKRQMTAKAADDRVRDMNAQLVYAPPGTAPRDANPKTMPVTRRESGSTEILVE
jgi:hypothetical protein